MRQCLPFPPRGIPHPFYAFKKRSCFTSREKQIMKLKEKGYSINGIASMLDIDINTVKTHLSNLLKKINGDRPKNCVNRNKCLFL
nr:LuxR C-terminal-related transcriptional regulator [Microbacter margulisiae]